MNNHMEYGVYCVAALAISKDMPLTFRANTMEEAEELKLLADAGCVSKSNHVIRPIEPGGWPRRDRLPHYEYSDESTSPH